MAAVSIEIGYLASTNNHAAGSTATIQLYNLTNLATGVKENKSITVVVGATPISAFLCAELWVVALNAALVPYGGFAFKGVPTGYGTVVLLYPYCAEAPFPTQALVNNNGMFTGYTAIVSDSSLARVGFTQADAEIARLQNLAAQLDANLVTANQQITVLEASQAGGEARAGSAVVAVNNPAVSTSQTIMAAIAGFGVGFMVAGKRETEE